MAIGRERDPAQLDAPLGHEHVPRHDVGVMLHVGEHDHIAGFEVGAPPGLHDEIERLGGVTGEDDLGGGGSVDERTHLLAGGLELVRGLLGDEVDATMHIGVDRAVVGVHRVEHGGRLLRGGGRIEIDDGSVVDRASEKGEVGPDGGHVEGSGQRHASYPSFSRRRASSGPPDSMMRPSTSTCTNSGFSSSSSRW